MEDKDFEEWWLKSYNKQRSKSISKGEKIAFKVTFREGVEFGKKENKVELKSYRETVDAMVTENEEWQKKVEDLKEGTIQLKKKAYIDLSSDAYEEWMKAYIDFGNLINSIFKTNNIKSEGNRMEE